MGRYEHIIDWFKKRHDTLIDDFEPLQAGTRRVMEFDGSAFVEIDRHKNYDCPDGPQGRFGSAEVCNKWLQPDAPPSGEFHSSDPPPGTVVAPKEMRDAWEKAQERQRQQWHP